MPRRVTRRDILDAVEKVAKEKGISDLLKLVEDFRRRIEEEQRPNVRECLDVIEDHARKVGDSETLEKVNVLRRKLA